MAIRTWFDARALWVPEHSPCRYTCMVRDEEGLPLTPGRFFSLMLTVENLSDPERAIVHGIDRVNILNAGRGTLENTGQLIIVLSDADNPVLDQTVERETHLMRIEGLYGLDPERTWRKEVAFVVHNLSRVPHAV